MSDQIKVEHSFTWEIENYSFCFRNFRNSGETLKSPIFTAYNLNESKWFLTFTPTYEEYGEVFMSCFLNRCSEDLCDEEIKVDFTIEVIDGNGSNLNTQKFEDGKIFYRGTTHGWSKFQNLVSLEQKPNRRVAVSILHNSHLTWDKDAITIRCQMMAHLNRPKSVALTEIGIEKCSFRWKLKLSDCVAGLQKKKFSFSETSHYEISIIALNDEIVIKVTRADQSPSQFLHGKIFLLNPEDVKVRWGSERYSFDLVDGSDTWDFPSFLKKDLDRCLKNGTFSLQCEFAAVNGKDWSSIFNSDSKCNNALILREDLSNLFTSNKHSDVKLRSGSKTFSAHKSLLSIRSPVFSAMFDQDMIEKKSGVVNISDVDPETLESFLEFIYSGSIVLKDSESALKLLMVAEKYQVSSLKETCSIYLSSALSPENLCEVLDVAEMLSLKQLKKCAMGYFVENINEILQLPQWLEFIVKNAKLSTEMISRVSKKLEITPKKN